MKFKVPSRNEWVYHYLYGLKNLACLRKNSSPTRATSGRHISHVFLDFFLDSNITAPCSLADAFASALK